MDKRIPLVLVAALLFLGCANQETVNTTTTEITTTTTTTTTTAAPQETTTTTTSTIPIPKITTTTTTTTTVIYSPTTTMVGADCYINSDCGEQEVGYYCKEELHEGVEPVKENTRVVYRYTYTPICLDPGTALARCTTIRAETPWDECGEGEECVEDCYTCVPEGAKKCPD